MLCIVLLVLEFLSLGFKRPGHEPDHSTRPTAIVKNEWIYTSTVPSLCNFVVWTGTSLSFFTLLDVYVFRHVTEMVVGFKLQQTFIKKQQDDKKREQQHSNYRQFSQVILRIHGHHCSLPLFLFLLISLSKIIPH